MCIFNDELLRILFSKKLQSKFKDAGRVFSLSVLLCCFSDSLPKCTLMFKLHLGPLG